MANHKRKRAKNRRCGCLLCKPWKVNGFRTDRLGGERFSDHRRLRFAAEEVRQPRGRSAVWKEAKGEERPRLQT